MQTVQDKDIFQARRQIKGMNIVDESSSKKKPSNQPEPSLHKSSTDTQEYENDNLAVEQELVQIVSQKRNKAETKEEKAERKEMLKKLKLAKKDKKKEFKQKFKTAKKAMITQNQNQITSGTLQGVSIKKV